MKTLPEMYRFSDVIFTQIAVEIAFLGTSKYQRKESAKKYITKLRIQSPNNARIVFDRAVFPSFAYDM